MDDACPSEAQARSDCEERHQKIAAADKKESLEARLSLL
jgi:hypothetical protein